MKFSCYPLILSALLLSFSGFSAKNLDTDAVNNTTFANFDTELESLITVSGDSVNPDTMTVTVVSDSLWVGSTFTHPGGSGGFWNGVSGNLPLLTTFLQPVALGQPYSFRSIDSLPKARVIKSAHDVRFYRREFYLRSDSIRDVRIRMTVDDNMEIYLNRVLVARRGGVFEKNNEFPPHDLVFKSDGTAVNGNSGGKQYDWVPVINLQGVLDSGMNEVLVAVRNLDKPSDKGGFSFRMDIRDSIPTSGGVNDVSLEENFGAQVSVYPNPFSENITLNLSNSSGGSILVTDLSGKVILRQAINGGENNIELKDHPKGVYLLKVDTDELHQTTRLIKR